MGPQEYDQGCYGDEKPGERRDFAEKKNRTIAHYLTYLMTTHERLRVLIGRRIVGIHGESIGTPVQICVTYGRS